MSTIATVAGLLSFIPGMGIIAVGASLAAMTFEGALMLAGAENASGLSFALAGVGAIAGGAALKAGSRLVRTYQATRRAGQLRNARTVTGLVTGKTKPVAPGVFRMARKGAGMPADELGTRLVQMKATYSGLAASGVGAPGLANSYQQWSKRMSHGRAPWDPGPVPARS